MQRWLPGHVRLRSRDGPYIHVRMAQPWDASLVVSTRERLATSLWPLSGIDGLTVVAGTRQASCDCVAQTQESGLSLHQRCPFTPQPGRAGSTGRSWALCCSSRFKFRGCGRWNRPYKTRAESRFWFADSFAAGRGVCLQSTGVPLAPSCKNVTRFRSAGAADGRRRRGRGFRLCGRDAATLPCRWCPGRARRTRSRIVRARC